MVECKNPEEIRAYLELNRKLHSRDADGAIKALADIIVCEGLSVSDRAVREFLCALGHQ